MSDNPLPANPPLDDIFTIAVHAGEDPSATEGHPSATPIHVAASYFYDDPGAVTELLAGRREGYTYARYGSPTVRALEQAVAALEGAGDALACASGMAALQLALAEAAPPDAPVLAATDLYGVTHSLLQQAYRNIALVDVSDWPSARDAIVRLRPAAVLLEVMSNPLVKIADLPAIAEAAHAAGAVVIVDSTFTTPYLLQPLAHGADLVVHSATKYLGGHGDVMGGVIAGDQARIAGLRERLALCGANLGPFEAWTVLRGLKTLPLRMREHCANALQIAQWLASDARVARVSYPGLPTHPQHALAGKLFGARGYGGMIAFEIKGAGAEQVYRFMRALKLIRTAPSLGDVASMLLYPAGTSHRTLTPEQRRQRGIGDGLVRLSVGIEAAADIIGDLDRALLK